MDPRHPQHPFSRSNASPYSHATFQTPPNQAPFSPASQPPSAPSSSYQEHQRRTSENSYYPPQPSYTRDGAPMPNTGHVRQTSASSIGHGTPVSRTMPPPSSPQQQHQPQPPHSQQAHPHGYAPPPLSRAPPPPLGPPMSFPTGRDLPSLSSINRPGSVNSSMSISSMLGGPSPAARDAAIPASQYPPPPPMMATAAPSSSSYGAPVHASPRLATTGPDYGRFRRPQTPEHQRLHDSVGPRDHRANSAGSPPRLTTLSTPESNRYGTPQTYGQRNAPVQQVGGVEDRREPYPPRVPNPNVAVPPRPSSQPMLYNAPPARLHEARLIEESRRSDANYGRPVGYGEREELLAFRERARLEEEALIQRDRDRMDRERMERDRMERMDRERIDRDRMERERMERRDASFGRPIGHEGPHYGRQFGQPGPYSAPAEQRETAPWMRPRHEQPPAEQVQPAQGPPAATSGYEFSRTTAPSYAASPAFAPQDARYPQSSYVQGQSSQQAQTAGPQFERELHDRQRPAASQQAPQPNYGASSGASYRPHESPRSRSNEDTNQMQRGVYLGFQQEINRKGRNSPFPQAVQGAQGQLNGPGGEPGIKSEFGKMFSGIGSGVGSMATAGLSSGGAQSPFSTQGQPRRDDLEGVATQDSLGETGSNKIVRTASRGGTRRRKLKDEDSRGDDDSSTGRRTPSGRGAKRARGAQNPRPGNTHVSRPELAETNSSPSQADSNAPFRIPTGASTSTAAVVVRKGVPHHHHINRHHHHHIVNVPAPAPIQVVIPKLKRTVRSQVVLDSVAHQPRRHLGSFTYQSRLKSGDPPSSTLLPRGIKRRGFASTPEPLPRLTGQENSTLTIKIPHIYLSATSREEITSRRPVWGTDIYSDDSDVIGACIHSGWFRGQWPADIDVDDLDLVTDVPESENIKDALRNDSKDITLTEAPRRGPMVPPSHRDLLVTVLILPALEVYSSTTRWGIRSRAWSKTHDGLSFMIMKIKWLESGFTIKATNGKGRKGRINIAHEAEVENYESKETSQTLDQQNQGSDDVTQSFMRGMYDSSSAELTGLGMRSWWKGKVKAKEQEPEKELENDKEQEPEKDLEKDNEPAPEGREQEDNENEMEVDNEKEGENEKENDEKDDKEEKVSSVKAEPEPDIPKEPSPTTSGTAAS